MAATVSGQTLIASGPKRIVYSAITLDNSYAAGGEVITANALGLTTIDDVIVSAGDDGWLVQWDQANLKFVAYGGGTATSTVVLANPVTPSGQDLSLVRFGVIAIGI